MSKDISSSFGLSVSDQQFSMEEELLLGNYLHDEKLDAELDSAIQDRFSFEASHPYEWSDYGFGADCSSFVYD